MTTRVPVKSILKTQPKPAPTSTPEAIQAEKDRHNYALALQHAHRIQDQKDWELRILNAIEVLLDYPSAPLFSPQEANTFASLVRLFQPSDLDALVEERVIDGKCGYALCANPPRCVTIGEEAEWRVGKADAAFCLRGCARKSMSVRGQLNVVPAWERPAGTHPVVGLHEDDRPQGASQSTTGRKPDAAESQKVMVANAKHVDDDELALERGEKATSFRPKQVMTDRIVEKAMPTYKPLSSVSGAVVSSTAIEGYEPRNHTANPTGRRDDEDSDDDDETEEGNADEDDEA
ncbi:hypothetical protein B0A55_01297 [Friedmanniomyces simplex]|uniref:RNA polymerase II subunit B1 CTD phosphatase RPAP2 homolog n=1 Tax=Friedmanniomyces simplex TaxID=329884 RepID=A0A4U0Y5R2_9PEZI|nr:hypothetical protein B0A55_01297 [Friedmanniomyces simplex]